MRNRAAAFCPAHITGFFEIRDDAQDPLRRGSRGAGVCLTQGVKTEVEVSDDAVGGVTVLINGVPRPSAIVSKTVAKRLLQLSPKKPRDLTIHHDVAVPIGSGFGTSGAAAIGVALAGCKALDLDLSPPGAYQLAHTVEVELKTGLGTVAGQYCGGLEVRAREGAPGYAEVFQVPLRGEEYSVVALHDGPLQTSEFLSDADYRKRINSIGSEFSDRMLRTPKLETFLALAHKFSASISAPSDSRLIRIMKVAREHGYLFGMAMFGQTGFTIVRENEISDVTRLIKKNVEWDRKEEEGKIIISSVDPLGARLLAAEEESGLFCVVSR